ncbi:uncharacterized protein LOC26527677 [Drosophila mojavensis]|uniref:Uncharacterized protein n=1 Tax=Drosophila mojavensis TaxID=7230 RepID=A0A0Q9XK27_DROMO|nr:uncharacterized protein LOC26527677 [Drosophila mojavensis]KRG04721.1 uncharacterized protein Dmoj_GI26036 [Drosophila mojavensis]
MSDYSCECKFEGKTFDKEFDRMWLDIADELRMQHESTGIGKLFQHNQIGSPCDSGFEKMWRQTEEDLQREQEIAELTQRFWQKLNLKRKQSRWNVCTVYPVCESNKRGDC